VIAVQRERFQYVYGQIKSLEEKIRIEHANNAIERNTIDELRDTVTTLQKQVQSQALAHTHFVKWSLISLIALAATLLFQITFVSWARPGYAQVQLMATEAATELTHLSE